MLFVFLAGVVATMTLYYVLGFARTWLGRASAGIQAASARRPGDGRSSLDTHIATEWTNGRLRPALRRFTFDRHLRNECRVLVKLLQFCANDLMESQGMGMTKKLGALAQLQVTIDAYGTD
jgi:hypothetical protein